MAGFNLVLLIFALVLALIGVLCLWWRNRTKHEIELMASTPRSTAAQAAQAQPGTVVKVIGTLRCLQPITSEFSKQPCAYFKAEIKREEVYYERDSDGKEQRKTRTTTIHSNAQNAACAVADDSGMVGIDFQGADVEAVEVLNQRGSPNSGTGIMGVLSSIGAADDRYIEHILAPDSPIYVLGEVRDNRLIGAPAKGSHNKTFVISHKSEEQRIKDLGSSAKWLLVVGIIVLVIAAGVLYGAWKAGP
jgi:flagellar basal body-associated protein FliL